MRKRKVKSKKSEKLINNLACLFSADIDVALSATEMKKHFNITFSLDEKKIIRDFLYQMYSKKITDIKRLDALMRKMTKGNLPNISYVQALMLDFAEYFIELTAEIDNKKSTC